MFPQTASVAGQHSPSCLKHLQSGTTSCNINPLLLRNTPDSHKVRGS